MITRFQQAVLQEMGIPLWIPQTEAKSESKPEAGAHVNSQPAQPTQTSPRRSENSSSHLAALRQSISGEKSPSDAVSAKSASGTDKQPPATRALNREEQQLAIMMDLSLAFENAGVRCPSVIEVGDELLITETQFVLPGSPLSLSAADKKQIWANISRGASA